MLGPAAEIRIMIRVEATMAAAASQAVRRVSPGEPGRSPGDATVPSFSLTESPVPLLIVIVTAPVGR
jgi:hypothetical protein